VPLGDLGSSSLDTRGDSNRIPPEEWIKGKKVKYVLQGGKVMDLANKEEPPLISGMSIIEVPLERDEIMKCFYRGWDGAEKDVKEIKDSPGGVSSKRAQIMALMVEADLKVKVTPAENMEGHTFYAFICGYRMSLYFSLRKYPVLMLAAPTTGIQGKQLAEPNVVEEIESQSHPY